MVFDSWGGVLSDGDVQGSAAYNRRVLGLKREHGQRRIPHIVFTRAAGCGWRTRPVDGVAPDVVGLDWTMNLRLAARLTSATAQSPCKATSTPTCCSPPSSSCAGRSQVLEAFGTPRRARGATPRGRTDPSSTSATASIAHPPDAWAALVDTLRARRVQTTRHSPSATDMHRTKPFGSAGEHSGS